MIFMTPKELHEILVNFKRKHWKNKQANQEEGNLYDREYI